MVLSDPARRLKQLAHASGVDAADISRTLPGDELIDRTGLVVDRAMTLPAPPERVWPWLLQLGKGRAGWYLPRRVERLGVPPAWRPARSLLGGFQHLAVGDDIPDWGPGEPVFRAVTIDEPHALVYLSLRDRKHHWRWPHTDDAEADGVTALSWALVLDPVGSTASRLHIRLRMRKSRRPLPAPVAVVGGLFDYATIELLRRGLVERLTDG